MRRRSRHRCRDVVADRSLHHAPAIGGVEVVAGPVGGDEADRGHAPPVERRRFRSTVSYPVDPQRRPMVINKRLGLPPRRPRSIECDGGGRRDVGPSGAFVSIRPRKRRTTRRHVADGPCVRSSDGSQEKAIGETGISKSALTKCLNLYQSPNCGFPSAARASNLMACKRPALRVFEGEPLMAGCLLARDRAAGHRSSRE